MRMRPHNLLTFCGVRVCVCTIAWLVRRCVDNFFSAAAAALEFCAAVRLRATHPTRVRPFRIPCATVGLATFLLLPFGISVTVMWVTVTHSLLSLVLCCAASLLGVALYLPWAMRPPATSDVPDEPPDAVVCVVPIAPGCAPGQPAAGAAEPAQG